MSFDLTPFGTPVQEPRPGASLPTGEGRTLTLRLRSPAMAAHLEILSGSLTVPAGLAAMPHTLRAGVVRHEAAPLTLTFQRG